MAKTTKSSFNGEEFIIGADMCYEDVVWKYGDTQKDRTRPGFPGHTPIYPTEQAFFDTFVGMCDSLGQKDPTKFSGANAEYSPNTSPELFHMFDDTGIKRNHALILGVVLGLDEKKCREFVAASYEDYKIKHPKPSSHIRWGLGAPLKYEDVRKVWEEKMAVITPTFREVLGIKSEDVPDIDFKPKKIKTADREPDDKGDTATTAHVLAQPAPTVADSSGEDDKPAAEVKPKRKRA